MSKFQCFHGIQLTEKNPEISEMQRVLIYVTNHRGVNP